MSKVQAIKTQILPGLAPGFQAVSSQIISKPTKMLHTPKKRICPSRYDSSSMNILRQPLGDTKGNSPSTTSTSARASQTVSLLTPYFLELAGAAPPPLRMVLKNSDDDGSSSITSLLFAKLAL